VGYEIEEIFLLKPLDKRELYNKNLSKLLGSNSLYEKGIKREE